MNFKALFSLAVAHAYHGGRCADVEWVVPADTAGRLRSGRLLVRSAAGRLDAVAAVVGGGAALYGNAGLVLRFGLRLTNGSFPNYTALPADFSTARDLYRNGSAADALDGPQRVRLAGSRFSHELAAPAQETAVTLKDGQGQVVKSEHVAANTRTAWSCDLSAAAPGLYAVEEAHGGAPASTAYYVDDEFSSASVLAVVEIRIDAGFYGTAPEFVVPLAARQETLKYYVVATRYTDADCALLSVADAGFAADGRPAVDFDRVASGDFTAAEIAPDLISASNAKVILFKSRAPVARKAQGRTGIQLKRDGEIVMANLPQPAPNHASANLIVSVAKP